VVETTHPLPLHYQVHLTNSLFNGNFGFTHFICIFLIAMVHSLTYLLTSNTLFLTDAPVDSDDAFDEGNDRGETDDDDDGMLYLPDLEKLRGK
jgi:hypothetical protein